MITDEQIKQGLVKVGIRVYYTRKDGSRVYGTVRNIYADKKELSMKPEEPVAVGTHTTYPQTFRFRRLAMADAPIGILGIQVAPLVVFNTGALMPGWLKHIYSCREGLFVTDGYRVFLEKVKGLPGGYMKEEYGGYRIFDIDKESLKKILFDGSMIVRCDNQIPVHVYSELKLPDSIAHIEVNKEKFNRHVKAVEYSGGYHTKHGDWAKLKLSGGTIYIETYNRLGNRYGDIYKIGKSDGILYAEGEADIEIKLLNLKDMTRGIRTGSYRIDFNGFKIMSINTMEQRRVQFDKRGWSELFKRMNDEPVVLKNKGGVEQYERSNRTGGVDRDIELGNLLEGNELFGEKDK